jgi:hypothetical protein
MINENSSIKGKKMKWDQKKVIHEKLVSEIQQIQAKMDVPTLLHPDTSKDIQKLAINIKEKPK